MSEQPAIKKGLLRYLHLMKTRGKISRTADLVPHLVELLNRKGFQPKRQTKSGRPETAYVAADLKNLSVRPSSPLVLGLTTCEHIVECLDDLTMPGLDRRAHFDILSEAFPDKKVVSPIDNYTGQFLFPPDGKSQKEGSEGGEGTMSLKGDYVLFRPEARRTSKAMDYFETRVSQALVRFYTPPATGGLRFMFLPYTFINEHLGAKGWVDDMGKALLLTGQVIDRTAETLSGERIFGGCSITAVRSRIKDRFVCYSKTSAGSHIVQAAPTIGFRALSGRMPSISRGYLVRARGVEGRGGIGRDVAADRYPEIRKLQEDLYARHKGEMTLPEAARHLAKITGFRADHFFTFSHATGPRGLLVNMPFRGDDPSDDVRERPHLEDTDIWPLALPDENTPFWAQQEEARSKLIRSADFGVRLLGHGS